MGPEQLRAPGPPRYATRGISVRCFQRCDEEKGETSPTRVYMPDSQLNGAERGLQQPFSKSLFFNGLMMLLAVGLAYLPIRALPDLRALPPATSGLVYRPVTLPAAEGPLRLVGAWELETEDHRFGGLSALALEDGHFLTVGDRGSVARFPKPMAGQASVWVADLRDGPRAWGERWARDAESLASDPQGRGWWVGYEQNHSIYLYDTGFGRALTGIDLRRKKWPNNRGAEGLLPEGEHLLVLAVNGRKTLRVDGGDLEDLPLRAGADVAEAASAPDGSAWLLLRSKGLDGIQQSIARLIRTEAGYLVGKPMPVPKAVLDNYEGMAIEQRPGGGLRFWLITDDGHRIMARTLLVALDLDLPIGQKKSPARGAGLPKKRNGKS